MINGCPGRPICHQRGVRQGDPLSPMLFIIAMDFLDRIFRKDEAHGILQSSGNVAVQHQCSFYADDVILFASPTQQKGRAVARLQNSFGAASRLRINMHKSSITPIVGGEDDMAAFLLEFPCQVQQFHIRYLGVPLSVHKPLKSCIRPVIEKVAAKLTPWHGSLMNKSGRLIVVKTVSSAVPIYTMMANNLPAWAIEEIDAIRLNFLWTGDQPTRGKCLVAWSTVCRPTTLGDLGILDLKLGGIALQSRWLWLQNTDSDRA